MGYTIKAERGRYADRWCVFHPEWRDGKSPVTEGSIWHCIAYVKAQEENS